MPTGGADSWVNPHILVLMLVPQNSLPTLSAGTETSTILLGEGKLRVGAG